MGDKWAGITVKGDGLHLVVLNLGEKIEVVEDTDWPIQSGDRYAAYAAMHDRVTHYFQAHSMAAVAIRGSAVSRTAMTKAHLEAAELRGVVIAAAVRSATTVRVVQNQTISRNFGERKLDEYVTDKDFWKERLDGSLCRPGKEAAMLVLMAAGRK